MFTPAKIKFLLAALLSLPLSLFGQGFPLGPPGGGGGSGTVTSIGVTGSTGLTVGGSPIATSGTITLTLDTELGQIAALADPNANRFLFWDDAGNTMAYGTFGSGLTFSGGTLTATSLGDGDKGDIVVSSSGSVWTIDTAAVTLAKMANLSTSTFIGRNTAGTGVPEELSVSTAKTMLGLTGTNGGDVTLAGSLTYLTIAGQVITRNAINLATDTTGSLAGTSVSFSDPQNRFAASNVEAALVELNSVDGSGPNTATAKIDWSQIGNMPPGFADGIDDTGGGGGGSDASAIHVNVAGEIAGITAKTTPVAADKLVIEDSAATNAKKSILVSGLKTPLEGVLTLSNLQGSVTDAQVPDTITVAQAQSGDSATAFFTSGQIERARGGTGADTSAYGDGLIGSLSGGATVDVDTIAELETAIGGTNIITSTEIDTLSELNALITDADLVPQSFTLTVAGTANEIASSAGAQDLSTNRSWTLSLPAVIDLSGKTSFRLPSGVAPVVNTFGQIAADNNEWATNRGAPIFYDGTATVALVGTLVSDTPTAGQIPRWNSDGTITWETFSATPGGSSGQVQYNNAGSLDGATGLTWNNSTNVLTVPTLATTTLNATTFRILDNVDQSHALNIVSNEDLTSDVNLNVDVDGVSRNLNITGNVTLSGTNTGDQTITLTGPVTGSGTGSIATTLAASQTVTSWTLTTPTISGAITFPDGVRQTFNPDNTNAGLNVGSNATDPSSPSNGDVWYDSGNNTLDARINGATVNLGSGTGAPVGATYLTTTADGTLTNEVVVGTTPGGELGGTWASPTIDDGVTVDAWVMGVSTGTTPAANDNTTKLATTAYVQTELTAYASDTVSFTNKTSNTPTAGDSSTAIATTAFVQSTAKDTITGSHASPSTTNPLSPTWTSVTQVVFYGATGTVNLPAASTYSGRSIIIYNTGAFTITIDSNASEVIVRDGTVQTGGVSMTLSSGAGNYVALICDGTRWITLGFKGTLAVGS